MSFVKTLWRTDAPLTAVGLGMIGLLVVSVIGLMVDPRVITGAPAWLKPAKFAASIAIYTLTLAWVFSYLPEWRKTRRYISWISAAVFVIEIVIINLQAWRGTTSHFNVSTPMNGMLFTVMGIAIVVQTFSAIAVAAALWRQRFADRALGWALRFGMTISIVGALTGGLMTRPTGDQRADLRAGKRVTVVGAHSVGGPDGGPGVPGTGWSREHGDIRVAHFIGLHALQTLPLVAFLTAGLAWSESRRVRTMIVAAASYFALFTLLMWQALRGQSIVSPDVTMMAALGSWMVLTTVGVWMSSLRFGSSTAQALVY